jgi:hypothetical protein
MKADAAATNISPAAGRPDFNPSETAVNTSANDPAVTMRAALATMTKSRKRLRIEIVGTARFSVGSWSRRMSS